MFRISEVRKVFSKWNHLLFKKYPIQTQHSRKKNIMSACVDQRRCAQLLVHCLKTSHSRSVVNLEPRLPNCPPSRDRMLTAKIHQDCSFQPLHIKFLSFFVLFIVFVFFFIYSAIRLRLSLKYNDLGGESVLWWLYCLPRFLNFSAIN